MGKRTASAETLKPDPRHKSKLASKFINCLMWQGKKATAQRIFYGALDQIKKRMPDVEPIEVFTQAVEHVKPTVELRSKRVGGATDPVPIQANRTRQHTLVIRGQSDAGRTTAAEHLLFYAGAKHRLGAVDSGTTETDYDAEEQERGITLYSACIPFKWQDCTINLIDTPGHVDFTAEVERSLRVLDGCVVVFDAQKGVEAQPETVWRQAAKYQVPRLVFVNKLDWAGANFGTAVAEVGER